MNRIITTLVFLIAIVSLPSIAGSAQHAEIIHSVEMVEKFAKDVERFAANEGARAFIIARVGRPESELPKGISFTHTAIAIYSSIELENGEKVKGYAIHNLYQKTNKLNQSELVVDYPVDFFWGVHHLKAGIIIPTPALQQRLIELIATGKNKDLHNEKYSVIANPFDSTFQNCTEYTLDIINAGIYQTTDIDQLKINAKQHYQPQRVKVSPVKLLLGNLFTEDVSTKDHQGKIYTATFSTIGQYLQENTLLTKAVILHDDGYASHFL